MRYMAVVFALLMVFPYATLAAEIFDEEFDSPSGWWGSGNPPSGWEIFDDGDQQANDYHQYSYGGGYVAYIYYYPSEYYNSDVLVKWAVDCSDYYNIELSYWINMNWYCYGWYSGFFYVAGSNDEFSYDWHTLLLNYWSSQIYYATMSHDISSWADYESTVGMVFVLYIDDTWGMNYLHLDQVHLEGDFNNAIQPTSLGKIKAMYE